MQDFGTARRSEEAPHVHAGLRSIILAVVLVLSHESNAQPTPAPAPTNSPWLASLDDGYMQSQRTRQAILVFVGIDAVPASRQLWETLQSPALAEQIGKFVHVRLDPDADKAADRFLGIVDVPALRLLTPDGRVVASKEGSCNADELVAWLIAHAVNAPTTGVDSTAIDDVVRQLGNVDPSVREAAVRALRTRFDAAGAVVETLATGTLTARLAAMDVLERLGAPTGQVDPWQQTTLTPDRLMKLRAWAKASATTAPATSPTTRTAVAIAPNTIAELDALVNSPTEPEARAVRERLVQYGEALLPSVYSRLGKNPPDPARQRLVALRYRLVATDRLAGIWPGGFDRLASNDSAIRRAALAELGERATPDDHRLLRELFGDADPFVREQSLRMLRAVGGAETDRAMVSLLADPEPDVRAAVLKTLYDNPDASLADDLVAYAAKEADTDLLVHLVHVLQVTPGDQTLQCLKTLLSNTQWRVRGEAAEALREKLSTDKQISDEQKGSVYVELEKRLDDPDGYVVNRAGWALIKSDLATAAGPLMAAVQRRPELAHDVFKAISQDDSVGKALLPQIIPLAANHEPPAVRREALLALARLTPETCGPAVGPALHDADAGIRRSAMAAVMLVLEHLFPRDGTVTRSRFFGFGGETTDTVDIGKWVEAFRKGNGRPLWLGKTEPDLLKALDDPDMRTEAAVALCALGNDEPALPVLTAAVDNPQARETVSHALIWLPWEAKINLYQRLSKAAQPADIRMILQEFVAVPDDRAAAQVWDLLGDGTPVDRLENVYTALLKLYLNEQTYNVEQLPLEQRAAALKAFKQKTTEGAELQKTVALALLLPLSAEQAATVAKAIYDDPRSTEWLRLDSLQVLLTALPDDEAEKTAIAALADRPMRKVAVPYLAAGASSIQELRGRISLSGSGRSVSTEFGGENAIIVRSPAITDAGPILETLHDSEKNSNLAEYAGYLLALMNDRTGYDALLAKARSESFSDPWGRLAYRAVAKLNDGEQTPFLEDIFRAYQKNNQYEVREFYWTIRTMTGEKILELRKTIRDEVGMDRLR